MQPAGRVFVIVAIRLREDTRIIPQTVNDCFQKTKKDEASQESTGKAVETKSVKTEPAAEKKTEKAETQKNESSEKKDTGKDSSGDAAPAEAQSDSVMKDQKDSEE